MAAAAAGVTAPLLGVHKRPCAHHQYIFVAHLPTTPPLQCALCHRQLRLLPKKHRCHRQEAAFVFRPERGCPCPAAATHLFHLRCLLTHYADKDDAGSCPLGCASSAPPVAPAAAPSTLRIGIDFGGVISGGSSFARTTDTMFSSAYLRTPAVPWALEGIRSLVAAHGPENVFIVSKAKAASTRERTLHWLDHCDFYAQTGLLPRHVIFTDTRAEKKAVAETLGLHVFIDDHAEVLEHVSQAPTAERLFLLSTCPNEALRLSCDPRTRARAVPVASWPAILEHLGLGSREDKHG